MSGDVGKLTLKAFYDSKKVPDCEENSMKNLEFEGLIKKIGFYQR